MQILLIYKLATKPLEIKKPILKSTKVPKVLKYVQKLKIFHKNMYKMVYEFPLPTPNSRNILIRSPGAITNHQNTQNVKQNKTK